jgi:S-adenosylmethionine hydrolase
LRNTERIALLTDFGSRDPYVAAMKGVLASRTSVPIFDLSHEIAPFDVLEAAWFLRCVVAYWPAGTLFVCVIDPGVGSARDIVAVEREGHMFLAPDNGLLTMVLSGWPLAAGAWQRQARRVTNDTLFLPNGSATFHGRDRFAPVAAALANGLEIGAVGPPAPSILTLPYEPPRYGETTTGTIVAIDRFGNAVTDIEAARVPFAPFVLQLRDLSIERLETNYADAAPGAFMIVGSMGTIEISVKGASAAERLHLHRLDQVQLRPLNV